MENISRNVDLLCSLCGNKMFESLDVDFNKIYEASDNVRVKFANCMRIFTKIEMLDGNAEIIEANIEDVKEEIYKQLEARIIKISNFNY